MSAETWLDRARRDSAALLRPNDVPALFADVRWCAAQPAPITRAAQSYLTNFWELAAKGRAPAFLGRAGTYKSYTAALVANTVRSALLDVAFVQCGPEFDRLERRRFDELTDSRLEQLATVPFLVLDDFTKLRPGGYAIDMLDALVERRYANQHPTLYTGNISISRDDDSALVNHFGVGFTRRFREGAKGLIALVK